MSDGRDRRDGRKRSGFENRSSMGSNRTNKSTANPGRGTGRADKSTVSPGRDTGRVNKSMSGPGRDTSRMSKSMPSPGREYSRVNKSMVSPSRDVSDGFDSEGNSNDDFGMIEGRNPVIEALRANRTINKILVAKGDREGSIRQIVGVAREKGIVVQEVDRSKLDGLTTTHAHQGVIAYASVKDYVELDDILGIIDSKAEPAFLIILDEITDTHNLGSILRTANAAGAHGVIIPKRRAVGLTATVAKASAGAIEYVPVARVTNIAQTIDYLKKKNIWIVGTDSSGEKPYYKSDLTGPMALVIGSEGEGISRLIKEKCDFVVNIPMYGQITSLNAAVAGALVMYEILRQRGK